MNKGLKNIEERCRQIVEQVKMPIDREVYQLENKDYTKAILFDGSLNADVLMLGRDLGRKEVIEGRPLIGNAGQSVRKVLTEYLTGIIPPKEERYHNESMKHVLFTNIVPYKPIDNEVFPKKVRKLFIPILAEFITCQWKGHNIIPLGNEAFLWFESFQDNQLMNEFWSDKEQRYIKDFECEIKATVDGVVKTKVVTVGPLPHPSPLNRRWFRQFPELFKARLSKYMPTK